MLVNITNIICICVSKTRILLNMFLLFVLAIYWRISISSYLKVLQYHSVYSFYHMGGLSFIYYLGVLDPFFKILSKFFLVV